MSGIDFQVFNQFYCSRLCGDSMCWSYVRWPWGHLIPSSLAVQHKLIECMSSWSNWYDDLEEDWFRYCQWLLPMVVANGCCRWLLPVVVANGWSHSKCGPPVWLHLPWWQLQKHRFQFDKKMTYLSLIHIWRCRRYSLCRSRWSPYH